MLALCQSLKPADYSQNLLAYYSQAYQVIPPPPKAITVQSMHSSFLGGSKSQSW